MSSKFLERCQINLEKSSSGEQLDDIFEVINQYVQLVGKDILHVPTDLRI